MKTPLQITFRHMQSSPAVEARIRDEVNGLDGLYSRITGCRVVVEAPAPHQHHGQPFQIRIFLAVPGSEIVVNHQPATHNALIESETPEVEKHMEPAPERKDVYISIAAAFAAARRQLEDYARVRRGEVKGAAVSAAGPDL